MRYLLDTNACIALLNKTSRLLTARVRRHEPADIGLAGARDPSPFFPHNPLMYKNNARSVSENTGRKRLPLMF